MEPMQETINSPNSFGDECRKLAFEWIAAWNDHDLEKILLHYSDDVEFTAQTVATRWNRADGTLRGKQELERHFSRGLELAPHLLFELEDVFLAPSGYAVLYRRENGNRVLDVVELDQQQKAKKVTAYYLQSQV